MAYTKYSLPADSRNHGGTRQSSSIRYIVYHFTANKTDKAKSNANYFKNNVVKASAHYFVDGTSVYQSVPDLTIAYSVGGGKYSDCKATGGGSMYGKITNANSISIEMCSDNGAISTSTINNAVELGKKLMKKYNIPVSHIFRHFDVNGKHCPGWSGWYGKDSSKWNSFLKKFSAADNSNTQKKSSDSSSAFQVMLTDTLNIRKSPGGDTVLKNGAKKGVIYTIVETSGSWGKLKSGAGWISISDKYVKKV